MIFVVSLVHLLCTWGTLPFFSLQYKFSVTYIYIYKEKKNVENEKVINRRLTPPSRQ